MPLFQLPQPVRNVQEPAALMCDRGSSCVREKDSASNTTNSSSPTLLHSLGIATLRHKTGWTGGGRRQTRLGRRHRCTIHTCAEDYEFNIGYPSHPCTFNGLLICTCSTSSSACVRPNKRSHFRSFLDIKRTFLRTGEAITPSPHRIRCATRPAERSFRGETLSANDKSP